MADLFENLNFRHIYFAGRSYTPDMILPGIEDLTAYLKAHREPESPFVYLFCQNHIKTVIAYFAILKAGMIVVPVDPAIRPLELADLMRDSQPSVQIRINPATLAFDYRKEVLFQPPTRLRAGDDLSDVCMLMYTAAEDGVYKGAMLTKDNLVANMQAILYCDNVTSTSVSCALAPFHHLYGLQTGLLAPLLANASVLIEDLTDLHGLRTFVADIQKCRVTNLYSLPVVYYLMARVPDAREAMKSVVSAVSGGYKLSSTIYDTFMNRTGVKIHEGYGLTEASPICTWHRPGDVIKIDSVGRAFSCCEVAILNCVPTPLAPGVVGEVAIRGGNVMKGYYGHPEATQAVLRDGWLRTGDIGRMDDDGYVYLTGLAKKMLNVGGRNVYPAETERLIRLHENVAHVELSGEETSVAGHVVKARVELRHGGHDEQDAFRRWCRDNLSAFKLPKQMDIHVS